MKLEVELITQRVALSSYATFAWYSNDFRSFYWIFTKSTGGMTP